MNELTRQFLEDLFSSNELNRLPESYGGGRIFATPLMGISKGDDSIFKRFKEVVAPEQLTPSEMWVASGFPDERNLVSRLRIVSIIFPYVKMIREISKKETKIPAEIYCVGRNYANAFMTDVLKQTVRFFQDNGYRAIAGMLSDAYNIKIDFVDGNVKMSSSWSERHIAFAAGLGTFSLHEGLITEAGCNIRVTSVITDAPLEVTPRRSDDPYANCLYYTKGTCRACEKRCPAGAITKDGHDKEKCWLYGQMIAKEMEKRLGLILKPHYRRINGVYRQTSRPPVGCAFCQFDVPCTDKNPIVAAQLE